MPPERILIRAPGFIGDSVMTTPALGLLAQAYPAVRFTVVCKPPVRDIFEGRTDVERVIVDRGQGSRSRLVQNLMLLREIRKERYRLGVLFHNSLMSALLFRLARVDTLVGYEKEGRGFLLDFHLPLDRARHYVNHYAYLANAYLGHRFDTLPALHVPRRGRRTFRFESGGATVGLALGGEHKGARAYPGRHLRPLVRHLLASTNANLVLLGDAADGVSLRRFLGEEIEANPARIVDLAGATGVAGLVDSIADLDCLVTIDSAPMHIAAAVGTPFVVLVGRSASPFCCVEPKVDFGIVLRKENGLIDDSRFVEQIRPGEVIEAVKRQLERRRARTPE